jgi:hypothetical protein
VARAYGKFVGGERCYRVLAGKREAKKPFGRPMIRLDYNIKMDLKEIILDVVVWFCPAQNRDKWWALVNTVMKFWVP